MGIRISFGLQPIGLLLIQHCFDDNSVSGQKVHDDGRSDGYVPAIGYIDNEQLFASLSFGFYLGFRFNSPLEVGHLKSLSLIHI